MLYVYKHAVPNNLVRYLQLISYLEPINKSISYITCANFQDLDFLFLFCNLIKIVFLYLNKGFSKPSMIIHFNNTLNYILVNTYHLQLVFY